VPTTTAEPTTGRAFATYRVRGSWLRRRRQLGRSQFLLFVALVVLTALLAWLSAELPEWTTPTMLVIPVVIGSSLLATGYLESMALAAFAAHCVVLAVSSRDASGLGLLAIFVVITLLVLLGARARSRLGVQGSIGESMLFDLRERLSAQGEMPRLPPGWQSEIVYRSAHGESFGGDFLVASRSTDGRLLEIALVDVSGKGIDAGTRALLLSGAFGGLLGSVPSSHFLPAANLYLLRQRWDEGFATAAQLSIDLETGAYEIFSAGHPPAVHFQAGSGQWDVTSASGPALGLIEDAQYVGAQGTLGSGDALLLYTDGVVETPDRDITYGIDRLLGAAEHLVTGGFARGAGKLINAVPDSESDDRALVVIWRN
jgi:hypothetical protein